MLCSSPGLTNAPYPQPEIPCAHSAAATAPFIPLHCPFPCGKSPRPRICVPDSLAIFQSVLSIAFSAGLALSPVPRALGGDMNCPHIEVSQCPFNCYHPIFVNSPCALPSNPSQQVSDKEQGHFLSIRFLCDGTCSSCQVQFRMPS